MTSDAITRDLIVTGVATSTNSNAYGQIIVDTAGNVTASAGSNYWFSINTSFRASA